MASVKYLALAATSALALAIGGMAHAATTINGANGVTLDDKSFGTGLGVHQDASKPGTATTVYGVVHQDGSGVTFFSNDGLSWQSPNGGGEAFIAGAFDDLTVTFEKAWEAITFAFQLDQPTITSTNMTLNVNGGAAIFGAGGVSCSICALGVGENKFTVHGGSTGVNTLQFTFNPNGIETAKQFRVAGPIPEPATWAMMILGVGGAGAMMRRRRRTTSALMPA